MRLFQKQGGLHPYSPQDYIKMRGILDKDGFLRQKSMYIGPLSQLRNTLPVGLWNTMRFQ